ncbi:hypothetical protein [Microbispora sp. NPDC049125]|uniref:hypothetical protein n=1 Tax=Microbispora sp. NPDC049125 TaxID=3154929 RepID=UPI003466ECFC
MKGYFEILFAAPAAQAIRTIHADDPVAAKFLLGSLEFLSTDLDSGGLRTIDDKAGLLKAAVGDFNVLFWIRREDMRLVVLGVSRHGQPA